MLQLVPPTPPLSAAEQFALDVLVDLSRLLVTNDSKADGIKLTIVGSAGSTSLSDARAKRWLMTERDGVVELGRPLLTLVAELAGAMSEQRSDAADRFGRVPASENALASGAEERDPVVNRVAIGLRFATIAAAGRRRVALLSPWPLGKRWAMAMTHDVDVVSLWPAYSAMRVAELLKQGDIARATQVAVTATASLASNPVWRAAANILDVEREYGVKSTWFVIAGSPTFATMRAGDVTYEPETPLARRIIQAAHDAGHEVGLHGSFESFTSPEVFVQQRQRLTQIARRPLAGVRQHFLRMRPGQSHAAMKSAGFAYDSTFGFSERNGFRLGVADVLPVWSARDDKALDLDEAPFVWMDRALSKYQNIEDPEQWTLDGLVIAKTCRDVEGLWTGIWHPNMDAALGFPKAPAAFKDLVARLVGEKPWAATLGEIVAWRRARRAARTVGSTSSGEIRLAAQPDVAQALAVEDSDGKTIPHVTA
jgi:hypothetical protein